MSSLDAYTEMVRSRPRDRRLLYVALIATMVCVLVLILLAHASQSGPGDHAYLLLPLVLLAGVLEKLCDLPRRRNTPVAAPRPQTARASLFQLPPPLLSA